MKASKIFDHSDCLQDDDLPIAFTHPCDPKYIIFIGGEMPHWVKKVVNRLESSSNDKSKVHLLFKGQPLSLKMIKDAWLWDDEGFGSLRKTVLTEDHFYKNAYASAFSCTGVIFFSYKLN